MSKNFKNVCFIVTVWYFAVAGENITTENDNKYLNNFVNISNLQPELIEYYDLDVSEDGYTSSIPPEIYPDPEGVLISKKIPFKKDPPRRPTIGGNLVERNDDLKEHDTIDNIMYIYYGSVGTMRKSLGGSIIIVGAVFALAAQILAIVLSLLRNRRFRRQNDLATISLNLLSTLCASNFVFIVGVQASKTLFKCEMIAVLLHYFHLSTSLWGLSHSYTIYDFIINDNAPNLKYHNLVAYVGSAVYVMLSFLVSSSSFEVVDYCWMSVARGMIVNFMIPISVLIVATTVLGTLSLRSVASKQREVIVESIENILEKCQHVSAVIPTMEKCCDEMDKVCDTDLKRVDFYDSKFDLGALSIADLSLQSSTDSQDYAEFKHACMFSLFFQPAFAVCWFLGVVALENRESCVMPVAFIIVSNILNWYILYQSSSICPVIITASNSHSQSVSAVQFESNSNNNDDTNQPTSGMDTIPLLCSVTTGNNPINSNPNVDDLFGNGTLCGQLNSWETSMENVNLDCISTISN
ncbi:uncharacterized protein LOC119071204 isoform X2 [Bradysia coprophila]|uniref:uncharacterized protein LOC119071204 isoform X2 n=1 Tax=Bradysia coprophila TaxID=38358 RepID=UPI00187D8EA7|nr:uncharacterized protein LOC119071204 isoform X2 [Bradysia coprophila]